MTRKVPDFSSDAEAESFLNQDLSDLDFSQFKPARFGRDTGDAQLTLSVPRHVLDAVKEHAEASGLSCSSWIVGLLKREVARTKA